MPSMPSAPRVLISIEPRKYAEVLAFLVGRERPHAEVSLVDPSEDLQEAALRLRPDLVVANRVSKAIREGYSPFWVELDEARAGEGDKSLGAKISADGYHENVGDVRTEHVLAALDRAEEELVSQGRSHGAQGSGSGSS
jgi:hypothetical protein